MVHYLSDTVVIRQIDFEDKSMQRNQSWHYGILDKWRDTLDWHFQPATQSQLATLIRRGWDIPASEHLTKGQAFALCRSATPKQLATLRKHGITGDSRDFTACWRAIHRSAKTARRRSMGMSA